MYTEDGYKVFILHINSYNETIAVVRPDGTFYEMYSTELANGNVDSILQLIPGERGTVIIPVYTYSYDIIFVSLDIATGETKELEGLYGTSKMWIERASGKTVGRDYKGFSFVDDMTGDPTHICDYSNINAPMTEVVDSELLYISDNGDEMILGRETYDPVGYTTSRFGYEIMHLSRTDKNPNAGKIVLTLSTEQEFYPSESDFNAIHLFNERNDSFFIMYVFPFNAIDGARSGNSLYRVPLDISASGIITASTNMPDGQNGFTFDQYAEFVDDVCNGIDPMSFTAGFKMGKSEYFTKLFLNMSDVFISDGHADLNREELRELMLFVDEHGNDNISSEENTGNHSAAVSEVISAVEGHNARLEGNYGAIYGYLYSFDEYIDCYEEIGEGIGIYSLPSFDVRGPQTVSHEFVSVLADTKYPEECAEFVKLLLSFEVQSTMTDSNPINRDALRYIAEHKLDTYNAAYAELINTSSRSEIPFDTVDKYIDILSSSYGGMNVGSAIEEILREESSAYFSGGRALEDVIPVMQKRVQTVLDEAS